MPTLLFCSFHPVLLLFNFRHGLCLYVQLGPCAPTSLFEHMEHTVTACLFLEPYPQPHVGVGQQAFSHLGELPRMHAVIPLHLHLGEGPSVDLRGSPLYPSNSRHFIHPGHSPAAKTQEAHWPPSRLPFPAPRFGNSLRTVSCSTVSTDLLCPPVSQEPLSFFADAQHLEHCCFTYFMCLLYLVKVGGRTVKSLLLHVGQT